MPATVVVDVTPDPVKKWVKHCSDLFHKGIKICLHVSYKISKILFSGVFLPNL